LKEDGLVKGKQFKDHRYVGDPINTVKLFNDKEVDELVFLDIEASLENREPNFQLIEDIASEAFMPLAYGGGVSKTEHIEKLFKLGVEKVVINSAFVDNYSFIEKAASLAGSQSIVGSIDVKKNLFGKYGTYSRCGNHKYGNDPVEVAKQLESAGVGEIMITSIDNEGTRKGLDLKLVKEVSSAVSVPVIANGGVGELCHLIDAVKAGASAIAAGAFFVFHGKHEAVLVTYPEYKVLEEILK
jgi:cyclase